MAYVNRKDTNGTKPLLQEGELGYDKYVAGGDVGRIYVGTGSENIAQAQKQELDAEIVRATGVENALDTRVAAIEDNMTDVQSALEELQDNIEEVSANALAFAVALG